MSDVTKPVCPTCGSNYVRLTSDGLICHVCQNWAAPQPSPPEAPPAKRVRTSDATNDIENAFKMWGVANNSIPEEAPHEVFAGEERAAIEAQDRVTTWLTQVAADQRQLHAALLACQAVIERVDKFDYSDDSMELRRLAKAALETK